MPQRVGRDGELEHVDRRLQGQHAELHALTAVLDMPERGEGDEHAQVAASGREHCSQLIDPCERHASSPAPLPCSRGAFYRTTLFMSSTAACDQERLVKDAVWCFGMGVYRNSGVTSQLG